MINIIVRDGAVITNELTEYQFMDMVAAVHGPEKTLDEYIDVFNAEANVNGSTVRVHKDVVTDPVPEEEHE